MREERPGERLRRLRLGAGLTQEQLAVRAGVAGQTVHRVEVGRTPMTASVRQRLARALGVSGQYLEYGRGPVDVHLADVSEEAGALYADLIPAFRRAALENLQTLRELQAAYSDERQAAESPESYAAFDEPETERIARQEAEPPPEDGP